MNAEQLRQAAVDYQRIEQAIDYMLQHFQDQPNLKDVAASVAMSEYHFQRVFSRWAGISPKRFLQYLTVEYAKELLERSRSVLEVTYDSGLSSPGRLHDLFVNCEAMTPGNYKSRGLGLNIEFGFQPSPFGECLLLRTEKGICGLAFVQNDDRQATLAVFRRRWQAASFREDQQAIAPLVAQIFNPSLRDAKAPLYLHVRGTNFQIQVWQALLKIPMGAVVAYHDIARALGVSKASRAVGTAVGQNPVSFLIPCHRVLRKNARISGYAWGPNRKRIMLGWEAVQVHRQGRW